MITANVAGSSGSHVRRDRRDSGSSISSADLEEIERKCNDSRRHQNGQGANGSGQVEDYTDEQRQALEEEAKRIRQLILEHRRKKFLKDYKTWGYLLCVATVVIGAIVIIILLGAGVISTDTSS